VRKIRVALLGALLILGSLAGAAAPAAVSANSGDCNAATVKLWSGTGGTGTYRLYCFGVSDLSLDTNYPTMNNMGPLYDGSYKPDYVTVPLSNHESGIRSITLWDASGGSDANVCIYYAETSIHFAKANTIGLVYTNGTYNFPMGGVTGLDSTLGMFRWTSVTHEYDCY
jgi:hypothetical protein